MPIRCYKPKIVETASVCYSEKIKIVSVTSEKIRYFFTADSMHFICFICTGFTARNKINLNISLIKKRRLHLKVEQNKVANNISVHVMTWFTRWN